MIPNNHVREASDPAWTPWSMRRGWDKVHALSLAHSSIDPLVVWRNTVFLSNNASRKCFAAQKYKRASREYSYSTSPYQRHSEAPETGNHDTLNGRSQIFPRRPRSQGYQDRWWNIAGCTVVQRNQFYCRNSRRGFREIRLLGMELVMFRACWSSSVGVYTVCVLWVWYSGLVGLEMLWLSIVGSPLLLESDLRPTGRMLWC